MRNATKLTRRSLLRLGALGGVALFAACQPKVVEVTTVVEKVVKETVEVEKVVKEAVEVEKEVTRVVEKVVEKAVAAPKQKVTVRWYDFKLSEKPSDAVVQGILQRFREANPHIEVKEESVSWGDHLKKLVTMVQGGDPPDVARIAPGDYLALAAIGALLPVTGLARKYGVENIWGQCPPSLVADARYNNLDYLMPDGTSSDVGTYNMKILREAGFEAPPATWEELVEFGQKVTDPAKDQWGWGLMGARQQSCSRRALQWCLDAGAQLFNEDGTKCVINSAEGLKGLKFWGDLELEYKIAPPGSVSADFQSIMTAYAQDRVVMWEGGPNNPKMGEELVPGTIEKTSLAAKPEPWKPVAGLNGVVLLAQTAYPDESFQLASHWCSKEANVEWCMETFSTPARDDVAKDDKLRGARLLAEHAVLMSRCGPDPKQHVKWPEMNEFWSDAMAAVLTKQKTAARALEDFEVESNKILDKWVAETK